MSVFQSTGVTDGELLASLPGFTDGYQDVNDVRLHYVRGGSGQPLILLPGWPQTWWAFHKIMPRLSASFHVIVVELRGMGLSSKSATGYDKKTMAGDIAGLVQRLGLGQVSLAGHDIGAAVAFSFAANYPEWAKKVVLIDLLHPEESIASFPLIPTFGTFDGLSLNPAAPYLWWWAFLQVKMLPEQLLEGRSHWLYEWFFDQMLANKHAITSFDRSVFYNSYGTGDAIRAANAWFQSFAQDIEDQKSYLLLETPILGVGAGSFNWMAAVLSGKAKDVKMVHIPDSGHFPVDEQPDLTADAIQDFLLDP
jgi:pimeloyl-ACP methyl ester carboxylesterase